MNLMSLSVKKSALAVIVCSVFGSVVPAMAGVGSPSLPEGGTSVSALTMHVVGVITNSTCNIRPYTAAGADATTLNLGVVTKGAAMDSPVSFFLKPENGCTDGIVSVPDGNPGSTTAEITWESNGLTEHGISNMYGTAKNVHIELSPVEGDGTTTAKISSGVKDGGVIKTGARTVVYKSILNASSAANAFKYNVKLVSDSGNMEAGTVDTDISYTVAYE